MAYFACYQMDHNSCAREIHTLIMVRVILWLRHVSCEQSRLKTCEFRRKMTFLSDAKILQTCIIQNCTSRFSDGRLTRRYYLDCSKNKKANFSDKRREESARDPKGTWDFRSQSTKSRSPNRLLIGLVSGSFQELFCSSFSKKNHLYPSS